MVLTFLGLINQSINLDQLQWPVGRALRIVPSVRPSLCTLFQLSGSLASFLRLQVWGKLVCCVLICLFGGGLRSVLHLLCSALFFCAFCGFFLTFYLWLWKYFSSSWIVLTGPVFSFLLPVVGSEIKHSRQREENEGEIGNASKTNSSVGVILHVLFHFDFLLCFFLTRPFWRQPPPPN